MSEDFARSPREADASFKRKKNTIKFLVLGIFLFLFSDIVGKWFVPEGYSVPGIFTAIVWCISIVTGFILYYIHCKIERRGVRIASALLFYIIFLALLSIARFFKYEDAELTGYRISVSLMPAAGMLACLVCRKFIHWYGMTVKRLFHLESTGSVWFISAFVLLGVLLVFACIGGYKLRGCLGQSGMDLYQLYTEGEINHNTDHPEPYRQYDRIFNDLNDVQLQAAMSNGLKGTIRQDDVEGNRKLREIATCRYYQVDELTHSMPYLVPKAADLVEDIGRAFQDSLFNRGYSRAHLVTVTSVLRTREQIKQLQKSNVNSTSNSAHCYGTTFDISYITFGTPETGRIASQDKMRQVLMEVMYDLRNQGRCYIKYEKKQTCLHITVR